MLIHAKNVLSNAADSKMDIMRRLVMVMEGCQDNLLTLSDVSRLTTSSVNAPGIPSADHCTRRCAISYIFLR